jgi:hypothetical protein
MGDNKSMKIYILSAELDIFHLFYKLKLQTIRFFRPFKPLVVGRSYGGLIPIRMKNPRPILD